MKNHMKKAAILVMIITLISKTLGFGRDVILSYFYGASYISDAYLISQTIPNVLFGFIGTAIVTAYIPIESKIESSLGIEAGNRYTSNLINIVLVLVLLIFAFSFIFSREIVKVFASGFHGEMLDMTVSFTRISLFGIFFIALFAIYSGFLQIKGDFLTPAFTGIPFNVVIIASIALSSKLGTGVLLYGTLIATVFQLIVMFPSAKRLGFRYQKFIDFKDDNIKETLAVMYPVIFGASINQINVLIDRSIASSVSVGGISALNYASKLNLFVQGIFVLSIVSVIYPKMARDSANGNIEGLKRTVTKTIKIICIFVIPTTIIFMVFSESIIKLMFGRGAFDYDAIKMSSSALFFYSIGMVGMGTREVLARAFYSLQDTKTPVINATVGVFINIVLNVILSKYLGVGGLALATSISALVTAALMFVSFKKIEKWCCI